MAAVAAAKFWLKISGLRCFENAGRFFVCIKGTDLARVMECFRIHFLAA